MHKFFPDTIPKNAIPPANTDFEWVGSEGISLQPDNFKF